MSFQDRYTTGVILSRIRNSVDKFATLTEVGTIRYTTFTPLDKKVTNRILSTKEIKRIFNDLYGD